MFWTPERVAELTRLWNEGLTTSQIGKRLGISKNAVVGKAHRLHLSARPSPIKMSQGPRLVRPLSIVAVPGQAMAAPALRRVSVPVPVLELSNRQCHWPLGHPGEPGFHFCTERALAGKPYCGQHAAVAYVKVKPKAGAAA